MRSQWHYGPPPLESTVHTNHDNATTATITRVIDQIPHKKLRWYEISPECHAVPRTVLTWYIPVTQNRHASSRCTRVPCSTVRCPSASTVTLLAVHYKWSGDGTRSSRESWGISFSFFSSALSLQIREDKVSLNRTRKFEKRKRISKREGKIREKLGKLSRCAKIDEMLRRKCLLLMLKSLWTVLKLQYLCSKHSNVYMT